METFFVHYLDSPEQALLVIPIFSEIQAKGGGTYISPDGLTKVTQYLAQHPEGVLPTRYSFTSSTSPYAEHNHRSDPEGHVRDSGYWCNNDEIQECSQFVEMTGEVGDVVLLHPLMMHCRSPNLMRRLRVITNPPVSLKEPFQFKRQRQADYSLVELKTLSALNVNELDFQITTKRRGIVPRRVMIQNKLLEEEKTRLAEQVFKGSS